MTLDAFSFILSSDPSLRVYIIQFHDLLCSELLNQKKTDRWCVLEVFYDINNRPTKPSMSTGLWIQLNENFKMYVFFFILSLTLVSFNFRVCEREYNRFIPLQWIDNRINRRLVKPYHPIHSFKPASIEIQKNFTLISFDMCCCCCC